MLATGQLGAAVAVGAMLMIVLALIGAVIDRNIQARATFTAQLSDQAVRLQRSLDEAEVARREREASEQALRASQEQLRMSQKMDAIGNLAGGIAHDFNNLLTVIRLNAELLLVDLPKERHADHQEVMTAVRRATTLTKQLLAYGRRQLLNPVPVSLNDIVTSTDAMLRRVIPKDIEMACDLAPSGGFALADRGQLEQVLLNLVVNSKDAMPSGGRLVIETRNVTLSAETGDLLPTLRPGEYVTLTVRDTGVGMTPEVLGQALEPYFTTKPEGKGSGLGLSMVYGLVRQTSGDLIIESTPGVGTVVRIFLPRVAEDFAADPAVPEEITRGPVDETILLVEDEPALRKVVSRMLRSCGYSVHEAENGQDALIRYFHRLDTIDLVLTDLIMPQMGGMELVRRLRVRRPGTRALFMSGYSEEALASGGELIASLIQKPFTLTDLTAAMRKALDAELAPTGQRSGR